MLKLKGNVIMSDLLDLLEDGKEARISKYQHEILLTYIAQYKKENDEKVNLSKKRISKLEMYTHTHKES